MRDKNSVRLKSLKASGEQTVTFPDGPVLACRFAERFGQWVGELAVPLIRARVAPLSAVRTGPGFECRNRNRASSGKLSAHAVGQAVDIAGFERDGQTVSIVETSDLLRIECFQPCGQRRAAGSPPYLALDLTRLTPRIGTWTSRSTGPPTDIGSADDAPELKRTPSKPITLRVRCREGSRTLWTAGAGTFCI